ncbi:MAG: alpha/beta hydrolase [Eubacteriales bacterium]|nr:alpha/beta hydrolase [Eubacteriales bacterium]
MPSLAANLLRAQIALLNPLINALDITKMRKLQEALGKLQQKTLSNKVDFFDVPEIRSSWAIPENKANDGCFIYLHGGSYTAGGENYAKGFGGTLADNISSPVLCVDYSLAPETPFPLGLYDAVLAYKTALEDYIPQKIALIGESAGGGLCFALLQKLRELNIPLPKCTIVISPWMDLTMENIDPPDVESDLLLNKQCLLFSAKCYAEDESLSNPLISPIFGDLKGFPDTLIFAGSDEILLNDSVRLNEKLLELGVNSTLHMEEGLWHAYVLYGLPESKKAINIIKTFFTEQIIG